jgi:4-diphosphocytidyl-2-C-methyl-D-erythritol kinase
VVVPDCHVVTGQIFGAPGLTRNSLPIKIADFIAGQQGNDCLPVVVAEYPVIAEAMRELSEFSPARLTGTGACVFAAFDRETNAEQAAKVLSGRWSVFVSRGASHSPLHRALGWV